MMKNSLAQNALVGLLAISTLVLSGCSDRNMSCQVQSTSETDSSITIAASFYPIYALTSMITEGVEDISVSCVVAPSDECPRSYVVSDWDSSIIANSSVVVLGGQGLESFENGIYNLGEDGPAVIASNYDYPLIKSTNLLNHDEATSHFTESDPSVYLSVDGAETMLRGIETGLSILDPKNKENYSDNLDNVLSSMKQLKEEITTEASTISGRKVIVMGESLEYIANDYGLIVEGTYAREYGRMIYDDQLIECLKLLSGCESKVVLIEKQAPEALVEVLKKNGYTVICLNIMTSISHHIGAEGWFNAMRENKQAILKGFGIV